MSWRDILKRDSLRNWFNSPYNEEGKKRRKGFDREMGGGWWGKPRTKNKGYQRSKSFDGRMGGINRFDRPTSRYTPKPVKPKPEPTPKPTSKPKRQIIPRTLIDNYFEMYANQGKGEPTLEDIVREEGRYLTVDEKEAYYRRKGA